LVEWAYGKRLPLVAANEPHFGASAMFDAHDALMCVAGNTLVVESQRRRLTAEHWFKGAPEMVPLFADLPEAIERTVEVARRVSSQEAQRHPAALRGRRRRARAADACPLRARGPDEAPPDEYSGCGGKGLPRSPRLRTRRHRAHGLSRLLPHRC